MTQTERTYAETIGGDLFEIFRIQFDGVRESRGFNRAVSTTRHQYRVNGAIIPKAAWFSLRGATRAGRAA